MVGGINPNASSAAALGLETRTRAPLTLAQRNGAAAAPMDVASSSVSDAQAGWRAARDSVQDGLSALDLASAAGRDALGALNQIADAARNGQDTQDLIDSYAQGLDASGADLLSGGTIEVAAEPDAAPISIDGVDIRLGAAVKLPADASQADPAAIARAAQDGAALLQTHLTRFDAAARALQSHAGFLGAAEQASGVRTDVDADSARLLALRVRQGLENAGGAIANAQPQAVLTLFKT